MPTMYSYTAWCVFPPNGQETYTSQLAITYNLCTEASINRSQWLFIFPANGQETPHQPGRFLLQNTIA